MTRLIKLTEWLNMVFTGIGGVSLILMTGIACVNMVCRLLGAPFSAAYELVAFSGAITVAFPLGYTQLKKSHISVDILSSRFSKPLRNTVVALSMVLSVVFFALAAWKVGQHATNLWSKGELSETTRMIYYPFTYAVAVSCGLMAFTLLMDLLALVVGDREEQK